MSVVEPFGLNKKSDLTLIKINVPFYFINIIIKDKII